MAQNSPYLWLAEPLLDLPTAIKARMFGCDAVYAHGRLQLVLPPGDEDPWRGALICTDRESQASLLRDFPELAPHPVLGKWLYISEDNENFESTVMAVVGLMATDDQRFGVLPSQKPMRKKRASVKKKKELKTKRK